jgi:mycothiol synthase
VREVSRWDPAAQDVVAGVRAASAATDGHDPLDEASQLRLQHHGLSGARLWLDDDGFALLHDGSLDLAVSPGRRGHGLGTALAAAAAAGTTSAWSHGDHPAAAALATTHGLIRARELWVMRRSMTGRSMSGPLAEVRIPNGLVVRSFEPGDEEGILRVNAGAFADHPEQGSMDAANLAERMAEPWFEPAGLFVVREGDQLLGFHWTKRHSPALGEVYVVAIAPEAQGRGLGKLLTLVGLHHLSDVDEVLLYVESDNLAARAVYERMGFAHAGPDTHVQYRRDPRVGN